MTCVIPFRWARTNLVIDIVPWNIFFSTGHKMGEESGEDSAVLPQSSYFLGKG